MRKCFVVLASPIHDKSAVEEVASRYFKVLRNNIVDLEYKGLITDSARINELKNYDIIIALIATGGSEQLIIDTAFLKKPVLLIAHSSMNSLPALLEAKPIVDRVNSRSWVLFSLSPQDLEEKISRIVNGIEKAISLKDLKLGLVGGISSWLVYSRVDPWLVKERFGIEIIEVSLDEVYDAYNKVSERDIADLANKIMDQAERIETSKSRVLNALKIYKALRNIIERLKLNAITVKCFDIIMSLNTTACLALAILNNKGIVAGCEGDVPSVLTMILLNKVSGKPVFMGNPSIINGNEVMIAHCTSPWVIGEGFILKSHFETGKGVGISVKYKEGTMVTIARLSPDLSTLRIIKGKIKKGEPFSDKHCRTQVIVELESDGMILLDKSIGNHYAMVVGDYVLELKAFAKALGLNVEVL